MVLKMFCLYDRKSEIHQPPMFCHNTGHALRVFASYCNRPDQMLSQYPEDFQLFEIGTFDDQTAVVEKLDKPHLVCTVTELITEHAPKGDPHADNNQAGN